MVYKDIQKSTFSFKVNNLTFYFSSEFYLNNFKKKMADYLNTESIKLKIKYGCNIYCEEMILLHLYKIIEKRGFRVKYKDKELDENYNIHLKINELSVK